MPPSPAGLRVWVPGSEPAVPAPRRPHRPFLRGLPTFLVLGAQKAGTTWLFEQLRRHPRIFASQPKELHYFSSIDNYGSAWEEYRWRFQRVRKLRPHHLVAGEATPNYLWASEHGADVWSAPWDETAFRHGIPDRIGDALGEDLRFVVMLRDPVDRAISAFYHHLAMDRIDREVGFLENARRFGIVTMGFYAAHLERYLERFPARSFLVLVQEEVCAMPREALAVTQRHLGVDVRIPDGVGARVHRGDKHQGPDGRWYFDPDHREVAITDTDVARLEQVFADENRRLEALLGRPLPWRHAADRPNVPLGSHAEDEPEVVMDLDAAEVDADVASS